jgi:hypothetical protein
VRSARRDAVDRPRRLHGLVDAGDIEYCGCVSTRARSIACLLIVLALALPGVAAPFDVRAAGDGQAFAWLSSRGLDAELEGTIELTFLDLTLNGFGHGDGCLDARSFSGWAWAIVWAKGSSPGGGEADLVGGFAVEGSPALGSGSVTGTCYFVLRRDGERADYRGTFVTLATSRLVPSKRPGALALEGHIEIFLSLEPCPPLGSPAPAPTASTDGLPWDSTRWPPDLLAELLGRFAG